MKNFCCLAIVIAGLSGSGLAQTSSNDDGKMSAKFIAAAQRIVRSVHDLAPEGQNMDSAKAELKAIGDELGAAAQTRQESNAQNQVELYFLDTEKNNISRRRLAAGAPELEQIDKAETACAVAMDQMLGTGVYSELPVCWHIVVDISHAKLRE